MGEDGEAAGEDQLGHGTSHLRRRTHGYDQEGEDAIRIGVGAEMDSISI
jgi:hypothetical protein